MADAATHSTRESLYIDSADSTSSSSFYRKQFLIFTVTFSLNHGAVTTPILYAASLLTNAAGQGSNAVLYGTCLIGSLFLSSLLFSVLGPKKGLGLSMFLYSGYALIFAYALSFCTSRDAKTNSCIEADALLFPIVVFGAFVGGAGASLLWTCQGAIVTKICESIAVVEGKENAIVTAEMMGTWGLIFLSAECVMRGMTTVLTRYLHLNLEVTFYMWSAIAFSATLAFMFLISDLPSDTADRKSVFAKVLTAVSLWSDPKLWLLQCTNLTFGFATGWLHGYIARHILSQALGAIFLGFAGAFVSGLAALLAKAFGYISQSTGKGPVIVLGAAAFFALGAVSRWAGPNKPSDWGWGAALFYVLMGVGRAVYESTNKAIFSDFFPGTESVGAFANVFVFSSGSSCIAFVLGATDTSIPKLICLLVFSTLTIPGYFLASKLKKQTGKGALIKEACPLTTFEARSFIAS